MKIIKIISFYDKANYIDWEIEVGKQNKENLNKLNRLIDFVMYSSDDDFKKNINDYFNLDSLLNYYIINFPLDKSFNNKNTSYKGIVNILFSLSKPKLF